MSRRPGELLTHFEVHYTVAVASGLVQKGINPTLRLVKDKYFAGTVKMQISSLHLASGTLH